MNKKLIFRGVLYGILTWLLPFIFSFFFFNRSKELEVDYDIFKSSIIIISTIVGALFLTLYFKHVSINFFQHALVIGVAWFTLNILLDVVILVPMMKISFQKYFQSIGAIYLNIPIMSIFFAAALHYQAKIKFGKH